MRTCFWQVKVPNQQSRCLSMSVYLTLAMCQDELKVCKRDQEGDDPARISNGSDHWSAKQ